MYPHIRLLHWYDLPETACGALVSVSGRDDGPLTLTGGLVSSTRAGGDSKRYEYLLRARTPEGLRTALSTIPKSDQLKILEIGLGPTSLSLRAEILALASWPPDLISALGRRYDLERHKRSQKPVRHVRCKGWNTDNYYDYFCGIGALLPLSVVKRLQRVVHKAKKRNGNRDV